MILVPIKVESVASSPLSLTSLKDEKPTLSFSELLHGARDTKDEKTPQNGSFVLSLGADTKELKPSLEENVKKSPQKESLSSLLKNEDKALEQDIKALELNPKITQNISTVELKVLISDAKKFLKDQILDSVAYKKAEVKDLPKTLKGLAQMAKTFGVDISKITLEEVKATPLFKAQEKFEHTTEQLVQTKQFKVEQKTPTSRADETLKLLLRGEKPTSIDTNLGLTKDFSVATARVVAPSATTEATKSVEQLLRGDLGEDVSKTDALTTNKADSFEVKLNEAKQMMKYLSQDVKTAIEDYKSPFTRIKVQLNPAKMGEVDLTVVQRGKNLHVNLSSNNTAINTLSMNVNDLKVQLANNGIQNATLNFSNTSQGNEQNAQQQHRQNERQAREEYNYFENEEQNEEILSSLEIVVPNYA